MASVMDTMQFKVDDQIVGEFEIKDSKARADIEELKSSGVGGGTPNAVQYVEQTLTDEQKTQARTNIGAASSEEVSQLSEQISN